MFDLDREPLNEEGDKDEKAALKAELGKEQVGQENEPVIAESPKVREQSLLSVELENLGLWWTGSGVDPVSVLGLIDEYIFCEQNFANKLWIQKEVRMTYF